VSEPKEMLKKLLIYYCQTAVFAVLSYGLILLIYGRIGVSFLAWILIIFVGFTVAYIPTLFRSLRNRGTKEIKGGGG